MNNNTFKNAFDTNFGANFNIATTNNINKIINTHYNIYPKNFGQFENKFRKNNEKRQTILKNSSAVNVLLTFFHYNNTNNNWFYGGNMLSFCYIKEKFLEIFEAINKFVNKTPDMFIRKFNFITEKFTNNNYEEVLNNNFEEILKKFLNRLEKINSNNESKKLQKNNYNEILSNNFIIKKFQNSRRKIVNFCNYKNYEKKINYNYKIPINYKNISEKFSKKPFFFY